MRMHDLPSFAASGLSLGYESASQQNQWFYCFFWYQV
jgi:hypothetical protein